MSIRFRTRILARTLGATLLLSTALTAWGVSIILTGDAGGTVSCTTSLVSVTDGNVTATVPTACIPTGGTGGGGTGPFTLTVLPSGPNAGTGTVTSADSAINCGSACSTSLASATPVSLTATAGTTGTFAGWSGGGCTGTDICTFSIGANTTVIAIFGPLNLTVTKAGAGAGGVTSGAIINCDAALTDCSESFNTVSSVVLTATPASGSTFAGWSGGGCSGTVSTCTVNMNDTKTVTATFNVAGACGPLPADVTVVDTGNLNVSWPTVEFSPAPATVMAFKVQVPSGFSGRDDFRATKIPPATAGKAVVVSSCPGSVQPVAATACTLEYVTDTALVRLSANPSDNGFVYCKLTPGQTYYINAFSKKVLGDSVFNCSSTSTCKFQAFRGLPY